jgi:hypothetical protein
MAYDVAPRLNTARPVLWLWVASESRDTCAVIMGRVWIPRYLCPNTEPHLPPRRIIPATRVSRESRLHDEYSNQHLIAAHHATITPYNKHNLSGQLTRLRVFHVWGRRVIMWVLRPPPATRLPAHTSHNLTAGEAIVTTWRQTHSKCRLASLSSEAGNILLIVRITLETRTQ